MKVAIADSFTDSLEYLGSRRFKIRRFLNGIKNWILRPYTTVKPRYIDHNYHDERDLLVHLSFELLLRYMESGVGQFDWGADEGHREAYRTMVDLSVWFESDYIPYWNGDNFGILHDLQPDPISLFRETENGTIAYDPVFASEDEHLLYDGVFWGIKEYEEAMECEIEENLKRLAEIRPYLWS